MEVSSRWTGRRGVSLPFTDFCAQLTKAGNDPAGLLEEAMAYGRSRSWRYLECRGGVDAWPGVSPSVTFYTHVIELRREPDALFVAMDGAVRRGIRKAEASGLRVDCSNTTEAVKTFYTLHCKTRKRHGLPPQPVRFFENIARHVLGQGQGFVVTARAGKKPVASALYFHHGQEALYKFGASDYTFQQLRPNNLVMWEAIKRCAANGFAHLHLGRTSVFNEGLRRFKLGFGAREEKMDYCKYDFRKNAFVEDVDRAESWANYLFRFFPSSLLRMAGGILYPHLS